MTFLDHVRTLINHSQGWDCATLHDSLRCWPVPRGDREDVWMGITITLVEGVTVMAAGGPSHLVRECLVEIEGIVREAQQRVESGQ